MRPSSAARSGVVTMQHGGRVVLPPELPAVTVASGSWRPITARSAARLQRRVGARVLVAVDDDLALRVRHGHRHELVVELAGVPGGDGALVRAQGELVLRLTRDAVLLAQVLRRPTMPLGLR